MLFRSSSGRIRNGPVRNAVSRPLYCLDRRADERAAFLLHDAFYQIAWVFHVFHTSSHADCQLSGIAGIVSFGETDRRKGTGGGSDCSGNYMSLALYAEQVGF